MLEIRRTTRIVEEPRYEPVSLAEAKLWCRVSNSDEDALLTMLIKAARLRGEEITARAFVPRLVEVALDGLPDDGSPLELAQSPLVSVTSFAYRDSAGDDQTLTEGDDFQVDMKSLPGRVAPVDGGNWPAVSGGPSCVVIRYRAGYVPSASPDDEAAYQAAVPAHFKNWMHVRICTFYDNRESLVNTNIAEFPRDYVDGLLDGLNLSLGAA